MKNLPRISIVIPSYNKARYIEETLRSIFAQKYSNLEVIIQDGGSTDGTLGIIKKFTKKHPEVIKWESIEDDGQLDAINKGLKRATGDVLAYINADDMYELGAFDAIAKAYENEPAALWFAGRGRIIDEKNREIAKFWTTCKNALLYFNSYLLLLATSNYLVQPSVFITQAAFGRHGPFTGVGKYVFEYELWVKLGRASMPVIIPKNLSRFRSGGANMTSVFKDSIFAKDIEVTRKYSRNFIIVFLHYLNNSIRLIVNKFL